MFARVRDLPVRMKRALFALPIVAIALVAVAQTVSAAPSIQGGADIGSNRIIVALVAFLAVGGVASLVTAGIRRIAAFSGMDPKAVLYVVCGLIALGIQVTVGLPSFTGDPNLFWGDVMIFVQTAKEGAQVLYNIAQAMFFPDPVA